jgi:hypothetical protein
MMFQRGRLWLAPALGAAFLLWWGVAVAASTESPPEPPRWSTYPSAQLVSAPRKAPQAGRVVFSAEAPFHAQCQLKLAFGGRGARLTHSRLRSYARKAVRHRWTLVSRLAEVGSSGLVRFVWKVPTTAPVGKWNAAVECQSIPGFSSRHFTVVQNRNPRHPVVRHSTIRISVPASDELPAPASANLGTTLNAGQTLHAGQALWSADGHYEAIMQDDGNFVVYAAGGGAVWSSGTDGNPGAWLAMQTDGNLVVYTAAGQPLWYTSTEPSANDSLIMQADGNLVIYSGGRALWSIGGGLTGALGTTLNAGQTLHAGEALWSADGHYEAIMQGDGNFVVYAIGGGAVWSSGTDGNPGAWLAMQSDGNLVVYTAAGQPLWYTSTEPSANDSLIMQGDGNLVIYSGGRALWSIGGGLTGALGTTLSAGQTLHAGEALWSAEGHYEAIMQGDGNFVVYAVGGGALWSTGTDGNPGAWLAMQTDGNLVVYTAEGQPLWSSSTAPSANDSLIMQGDGNLVIYGGGRALWSIGGGKIASSSKGEAVVQAAASMAGKPYCYAGGSPSGPTHGVGGPGCGGGTVGFDCSGLALFAVYQATGILLPHGHGMESARGGTLIRYQSELRPGDLVFFGGGSLSNFDHVGIYAGGGVVWDAANYYVPVQQHSLAWIEHSLRFDGAVRYF